MAFGRKKKDAVAVSPVRTLDKAALSAREAEVDALLELEEKDPEAYLSLRHVDKVYPNGVEAVHDFNLDVKKHEFIVLVGPSGCGKSTTIRMIAGLEEITNGELNIDGERANEKSPKDRDIAMVFQSYALYPHMTVYQNLAFGLKIRKLPKEEIDERVHAAAKILQIEQYLDRKPKALSGGQRQRVALGRAIVRKPKVFLMDEPLSNLDAKLRVAMRSEIIKLHNSLEATTVYVTHDQTEAMTMADRIVVMRLGLVEQIGAPEEIYRHPANLFVASFIGSPSMNFLPCVLKGQTLSFEGEEAFVDIGKDRAEEVRSFFEKEGKPLSSEEGAKLILGIRPEDLFVVKEGESALPIAVSVAELLGQVYYVHGDFASMDLVARLNAKEGPYHQGEALKLSFDLGKCHLFDPLSEKAIF